MLETFLFVVGYVTIIGLSSLVHYTLGYKRGITDTITSFRKFEPKAVDNAMKKMQVELEAHINEK